MEIFYLCIDTAHCGNRRPLRLLSISLKNDYFDGHFMREKCFGVLGRQDGFGAPFIPTNARTNGAGWMGGRWRNFVKMKSALKLISRRWTVTDASRNNDDDDNDNDVFCRNVWRVPKVTFLRATPKRRSNEPSDVIEVILMKNLGASQLNYLLIEVQKATL